MKAFHVICGLPRSGSTLLCNILAQNPSFHVEHTSPCASDIRQLCAGFVDIPEYKGLIARNLPATDEMMCEKARGVIEKEHAGKGEVCFDKNRLWGSMQLILCQLYPGAKIICCVRDLRAVFGSFEKRYRRNPLISLPPGETVRARMQNQFGPQGMIGSCLGGIEDLVLVANKAVMFVWYEKLTENPNVTMQQLYAHIGEPWYEHDFEDVENTASDPDWLYLGKFPHEGSGKVEPREDWQEFVPQQIAGEIMQNHAAYNRTFGYV